MSDRGYAVPSFAETQAEPNVPNISAGVAVDRCSSDGRGELLPALAG